MNNVNLTACTLCGSYHGIHAGCAIPVTTHPFCTLCGSSHTPGASCYSMTTSSNAIDLGQYNSVGSLHVRLDDDQLKLLAQYVADELIGWKNKEGNK